MSKLLLWNLQGLIYVLFYLILARKGGKRQYPENEGHWARENHGRAGSVAAETEGKSSRRSQIKSPKSERPSKRAERHDREAEKWMFRWRKGQTGWVISSVIKCAATLVGVGMLTNTFPAFRSKRRQWRKKQEKTRGPACSETSRKHSSHIYPTSFPNSPQRVESARGGRGESYPSPFLLLLLYSSEHNVKRPPRRNLQQTGRKTLHSKPATTGNHPKRVTDTV